MTSLGAARDPWTLTEEGGVRDAASEDASKPLDSSRGAGCLSVTVALLPFLVNPSSLPVRRWRPDDTEPPAVPAHQRDFEVAARH